MLAAAVLLKALNDNPALRKCAVEGNNFPYQVRFNHAHL
jgi:hypothetical protein